LNAEVNFRHGGLLFVLKFYSSRFMLRFHHRHRVRVWYFSCTSMFPVNAPHANHVGRYDTSTPDRRLEGQPAPFEPHTMDMPAPSCNSRFQLRVDESATSYSDFNRITTKLTSQFALYSRSVLLKAKISLPLPNR
jgi:hypothetical protein